MTTAVLICSHCPKRVEFQTEDAVVQLTDTDLAGWYFSTATGWRCPEHAPDAPYPTTVTSFATWPAGPPIPIEELIARGDA